MEDWKTRQKEAEQAIAPVISRNTATTKSGIYLFRRTDEKGITFFYAGQALNIYARIRGHWLGYRQRIDFSLRKRGWYSDTNPYGWKFSIINYCDEKDLDKKETQYILYFMKKGWQTYNTTYGSQGVGKGNIVEGKIPKGYYDGVRAGESRFRKAIKHLFDLHLTAVTKAYTAGKENKVQDKALEKFYKMLEGDDNDEQQ